MTSDSIDPIGSASSKLQRYKLTLLLRCFWINLPCGAVSATAIIIFVKIDQGHTQHRIPLYEKLKKFDLPGAIVLVSGIGCLLLAVQWGVITYAWSSSLVVALLSISGGLLLLFAPIQWRSRDNALVPLRILGNRNVLYTMIYHVLLGAGITIYEFYVSGYI